MDASNIGFCIPAMQFGDPDKQLKAAQRCLEHISAARSSISERMVLLVQATRSLPDGYLRLQLQRRLAARAGESLRWVDVVQHRIIADGTATEVIRKYPGKIRQWYAVVQAEAKWLNVQERLCRQAEKELSSLSAFLIQNQNGGV